MADRFHLPGFPNSTVGTIPGFPLDLLDGRVDIERLDGQLSLGALGGSLLALWLTLARADPFIVLETPINHVGEFAFHRVVHAVCCITEGGGESGVGFVGGITSVPHR